MNNKDIKNADLKYWRLLLQGLIRGRLTNDDVFVNMDVFSLLLKYIGLCYQFIMAMEAKSCSLAIINKETNMTPKEAAIHDGRIEICASDNNQLQQPQLINLSNVESSTERRTYNNMKQQMYSNLNCGPLKPVLSCLSECTSASPSTDPPSPTPSLHPQEMKLKNKLLERGVFNIENFEKGKVLMQEQKSFYNNDDDIHYEHQITPNSYYQLPSSTGYAIGDIDDNYSLILADSLELQSDYDEQDAVFNNEEEDDIGGDDDEENLSMSYGDCLEVQSDFEESLKK